MLICSQEIDDLRRRALRSPKRRARICAHTAATDSVHEMLIAIARDSYIRPHLHLNKSESFHMVDGRLDIILFDEDGRITGRHALGDHRSGLPFYYRGQNAGYHTVIVRSEVAVFHETTNGPFVAADTRFSPWSPEESDADGVARFIARLKDGDA